jgi:hypothetical protein
LRQRMNRQRAGAAPESAVPAGRVA